MRASAVVLSQHPFNPTLAQCQINKARFIDKGSSTTRKVSIEGEPLLRARVIEMGEPCPVLVVTAAELDIIKHDPNVRGIDFGQRAEAGEEVRLVDGAPPLGCHA